MGQQPLAILGMAVMNVLEERQTIEMVDGGNPRFPPVLSLPMFERDFALMHAGSIYAGSSIVNRGVIVAIGHPGFEHGFYMGLQPEHARQLATWLNSAAKEIETAKV